MAQAVEEMEGKRRGKNCLASVLDEIGKPGDQLNDVRRCESLGRDEICDGERIQYYGRKEAVLGWAFIRICKTTGITHKN